MKKLIAILSVSVLLATASSSSAATFPQAAVFLNSFDSGFTVRAIGGGVSSAFFVQVLGGVNAGSMFAIDSNGSSPLTSIIAGSAGNFDGNFGYIPTVTANANGAFQVLAWEGGAGSTFDTATIRGSSAIFSQATGIDSGPPSTPNPAILAIPGNIQLALAVVPEPSTIALGVLGGLGLLLRRRK